MTAWAQMRREHARVVKRHCQPRMLRANDNCANPAVRGIVMAVVLGVCFWATIGGGYCVWRTFG